MEYYDHTYFMNCAKENDPYCIHTPEELINYIDDIGFLPLFSNNIPGFSVEERTAAMHWWSGDSEDPWEWRILLTRSKRLAYGKFFENKSGFISLKWLPYFVNVRRNGYDFDSLIDDDLATIREQKIMKCFENDSDIFQHELKRNAGFGKNGEKNFAGVVTGLQMKTYIAISDFKQRTNKRGENYGWECTKYSTPEQLWGYDLISSQYSSEPSESAKYILEYFMSIYPIADLNKAKRILGVN